MRIFFVLSALILIQACASWNKPDNYTPTTMADDVPKIYADACGECHFSFQAYLLPKKSWELMMTAKELDNHFGESIEFEPKVYDTVVNYLSREAGDLSGHKRGRKFSLSVNPKNPLSITDSGYFIRKHDELGDDEVKNNPNINSWSNCSACHTAAVRGDYDDDHVFVPAP